jgi:hypothetical protein
MGESHPKLGHFSRHSYGLQIRITADSPDHVIQITGGLCRSVDSRGSCPSNG